MGQQLLLHSFLWIAVFAPTVQGINPPGNPMALVPEITGPFEVKLRVRLNDIPDPHHALFHWTDKHPATPSSILLTYGTLGFSLRIQDAVNGNDSCSNNVMPMTEGHGLHEVTFSADGASWKVLVNGTVAATCTSSIIPSHVSRMHFLGESPDSAATTLLGGILGIMVVNSLDIPPAHPRDLYRFWNIPSQTVTMPARLVAGAYMRFDSLAARSWQRMFDFSNGASALTAIPAIDNNVICTQRNNTATFRCIVYYSAGGNASLVEADDVIVENEWAYWEFEIDEDGDFVIRKDHVELERVAGTKGHPNGVFRRNMHFGRSTFIGHDNLQGVMLGFRLDATRE